MDDMAASLKWGQIISNSPYIYVWRRGHHFSLVVLDLAAKLFTPETPNVFCGLKPSTPPSAQWWVDSIWVT